MSKRVKIFILTIVCFIIIYIVVNVLSICIYSDNDENCEADVIIVLGAATYDEAVSPVYRERLNHSVVLYEQGYADQIIVTGGIAEGNDKSDAFVAKQYLKEQGIPENRILVEEKSTITQENLEYSKSVMDENGMKKALIVSDPLHMKRAMVLAKDVGIEAYSSPTTTTMYQSLRTKIPFLAREVFFYVGYKWYRLFT